MNKLFFGTIVVALALVATPAAQAQSVRFGCKVGANLSYLAGSPAQPNQYKSKLGFTGGALLHVGLRPGDRLAIQLEALYSQKGFRYDGQPYTVRQNTYRNYGSVRYDYLDVPALLRLKINSFFLEAGPQYSYLLRIVTDRNQDVNGYPLKNVGFETARLSDVRRSELGYAAGVGFQASSGLLLGLRYSSAFTGFAKDGYSNDEFRNARHATLQAYAGVQLGGK
jgi:hypothetical protein